MSDLRQRIDAYMDTDLPFTREVEVLEGFLNEPGAGATIRTVLAARGLLSEGAEEDLAARLADAIDEPAESRLSRAWTALSEAIESALRRLSTAPLGGPVGAPAYLSGEPRAPRGELTVEHMTGRSEGPPLIVAASTHAPPPPFTAQPGDVVRFQFRPSRFGRAFGFAAAPGETPRLVYPSEGGQATLAGPDAPVTMLWQVDPAPARLRVLFVALDAEALDGDPVAALEREPDGLWGAEGETDLVGRMAEDGTFIVDFAEMLLCIDDGTDVA